MGTTRTSVWLNGDPKQNEACRSGIKTKRCDDEFPLGMSFDDIMDLYCAGSLHGYFLDGHFQQPV